MAERRSTWITPTGEYPLCFGVYEPRDDSERRSGSFTLCTGHFLYHSDAVAFCNAIEYQPREADDEPPADASPAADDRGGAG